MCQLIGIGETEMKGSRKRRCSVLAVGMALSVWASAFSRADEVNEIRCRCFAVELYTRGDEPASRAADAAAETFANERPGVRIRTYDITEAESRSRFDAIAKHFKISSPSVPLLYGNRQFVMGWKDEATFARQIRELLTLNVYVRAECPRCARGKQFLGKWQKRYPALNVRLHDISQGGPALTELQELANRHKTAATSVPVFCLCDQLVIGFDSDDSTADRLDAILKKWTFDCVLKAEITPKPETSPNRGALPQSRLWRNSKDGIAPAEFRMANWKHSTRRPTASLPLVRIPDVFQLAAMMWDQASGSGDPLSAPESEMDAPELELPIGDETAGAERSDGSTTDRETVKLPVLGQINASELGLPLFTVAVGLVDGFNPCAMWVLLFLLSLLVNLHDRRKILAVAGTFVLVSGLAYFAFMAAWLNVLQFVGMLRGVQITLASIAIVVGSIHVKDFFAFKRGISLSIPESAKPGIYARVRSIVMAEHLTMAIASAMVLAVLVNIVELLCTAGLPALYTQVLTMRQLPLWQNYAYLLLYDLAYMFDDSLMVLTVVISLNKLKMQETHGRWLKLLSGVVILAIGVVMLLKPEWLV